MAPRRKCLGVFFMKGLPMTLERALQAEFGLIAYNAAYAGGALGREADGPLAFFDRTAKWLTGHFGTPTQINRWVTAQRNPVLRFETGLAQGHINLMALPRAGIIKVSFWPETGLIEI